MKDPMRKTSSGCASLRAPSSILTRSKPSRLNNPGSRMLNGVVISIHIASKNAAPTQSVSSAEAKPSCGLVGDRHFRDDSAASPKREITLIELEAIEALK